jgi:hypothetical protein
MPDDKTKTGAPDPSAKRPYKAPVLVSWGTFRDITQSVGSTGSADSATKSAKRTRP